MLDPSIRDFAMSRDELRHRTRSELATLARQEGVTGWHRMRKAELVNALLKVLPPGTTHDPPRASETAAMGTLARDVSATPDITRDQIRVDVCSSCWLRVRWNIVESTLQRAAAALGADWYRANLVLQLLDAGEDEHPTGATAHVADIPVPSHVNEWFVALPRLNRTYRLRFGAVSPGGRFFSMVAAAPVHVPAAGAAHVATDVPEPSDRGSSGEAPSARVFGRTTGTVDDETLPLELSVELIVRGRTDPAAEVTVDDQPVRLANDGSFEYRSDFPDGRHVLPVVTLVAHEGLQQTVVLAVEKNLRRLELQHLNE
ncbi:hypothetical protein Mal4_53710 [Maioricimonas rarisocia]|uniref:Rho termination factor-like N-terminal domain-containing protein n=1 Tax=Maioricimonas rarisocia TaxID=2528026 RepID=A0A517ZEW8_9PLAN|nr:DUF4912 domain-containing protein [Maioricimonas rarisocia]QDU41006.1 hypothetical protein Mal4_53710 [Maioricimonas rarisocia]